ncbi:MAG: hypothetical protein QOI63_1451 [Thermoplasmata archaeon]|nr:hypothetical protein [Thermoplasmata archaeon]
MDSMLDPFRRLWFQPGDVKFLAVVLAVGHVAQLALSWPGLLDSLSRLFQPELAWNNGALPLEMLLDRNQLNPGNSIQFLGTPFWPIWRELR